ncbi:ubiquitin C-terminal hydrolase 12-like [Magnolia sinica]|uniref:ubiquitin C-terminal hydrolase 12-like n=1 Tax=Magnolia sinica TaxID=86752 RepID=UPI0026599CC7|nr:ubiquitin C-terminal hydrolase 12-like [Magnolia sinica]
MLVHYNQTSDILYYEVLDIPLPELQGLKTLKVAFHHSTKDEVVIHTIRLPKQSIVGDVINDLKTKVNFCNCLCTSIRCDHRHLQGFLNA